MPTGPALDHPVNPFETPVIHAAQTTPTPTPTPTPSADPEKAQQPDVLATADLLLEQLKELEDLCSTVEQRVQRKRQALKELEYLISAGSSSDSSARASPRTPAPACPANTPISARLRFVSPRLRGLFDLRGPAQVNLDAIQSCLDYSPETRAEVDDVSAHEDAGHSEEWVDDDNDGNDDDDEEPLISPFDDLYALRQGQEKAEKELPAAPREVADEGGLESRIPRKVYVRRQISTSRKMAGRPSGGVARNVSNRRRPSVRNAKTANVASDFTTKGTMRRGSWKRSIMENVKTRSSGKTSVAIENEVTKDSSARRRDKRKGLWSIYSVCSELGLNGGTYHAK